MTTFRHCERCGIRETAIGESLHVHHRDRNRGNNAPENLQVVCRSCHNAIHIELNRDFGRVHPKESFVKQSISFPRNQLDWLREEAERQDHGNISRIVQDAIREYRNARIAERLDWIESRELERVS